MPSANPHDGPARHHAGLRRHGQPCPRASRARSFAARHALCTCSTADRSRSGGDDSGRHRSGEHRPAAVARRILRFRAEAPLAPCGDEARAAGPMGWLCRQSRRVGARVSRMRLHRRALVLAAGRFSRRQRRLFAALTQAAGGIAGSAHRPQGRGGPDDRSCLSDAARNANTPSASRTRRSPSVSPSKRPIRSVGRSGFTGCSTSRASSTTPSSRRSRRPSPTRSRNRCKWRSSFATRWLRASGPQRRRWHSVGIRRCPTTPTPGCCSRKRARALRRHPQRDATIRVPAAAASGTSIATAQSAASTPTAATSAPTAEALAQRAFDAHRRGDLAAAEQGYRASLQMAADQPLALHYLGVIAYQRGDAAGALPLVERSTALRPAEAEFHNNTGLVLAALGRHDDAIAAFRRVLAINPQHVVAWGNLGLSLSVDQRAARRDRRVLPRDRGPAKLRGSALEPRAGIVAAGRFRARLSRVRMAPRGDCVSWQCVAAGAALERGRRRGQDAARHRRAGLGRRDPLPALRARRCPARRARDRGGAARAGATRGDRAGRSCGFDQWRAAAGARHLDSIDVDGRHPRPDCAADRFPRAVSLDRCASTRGGRSVAGRCRRRSARGSVSPGLARATTCRIACGRARCRRWRRCSPAAT